MYNLYSLIGKYICFKNCNKTKFPLVILFFIDVSTATYNFSLFLSFLYIYFVLLTANYVIESIYFRYLAFIKRFH